MILKTQKDTCSHGVGYTEVPSSSKLHQKLCFQKSSIAKYKKLSRLTYIMKRFKILWFLRFFFIGVKSISVHKLSGHNFHPISPKFGFRWHVIMFSMPLKGFWVILKIKPSGSKNTNYSRNGRNPKYWKLKKKRMQILMQVLSSPYNPLTSLSMNTLH